MSEIPVHSVIMRPDGRPEEPGYRNDGVLRIGDEEIQIRTTWWNWARHMAWPLGLVTSDLGMIFAGPAPAQDVVLTMRRDKLDSIIMRPDANPLPSVEVTGTREEDGKTWVCSFAYDETGAPSVQKLESYVPERTAAERAG